MVSYAAPARGGEHIAPAPAARRRPTHIAPAPTATYAAPAPVVEYIAPAPAASYDTPALVVEYITPAPPASYGAPAPVVQHIAPAHAVSYAGSSNHLVWREKDWCPWRWCGTLLSGLSWLTTCYTTAWAGLEPEVWSAVFADLGAAVPKSIALLFTDVVFAFFSVFVIALWVQHRRGAGPGGQKGSESRQRLGPRR